MMLQDLADAELAAMRAELVALRAVAETGKRLIDNTRTNRWEREADEAFMAAYEAWCKLKQ